MNITQNKGCAYVVNTIDSETATKDVDLLSYGGQLVSVVDYPDFSRLNFYEKAISLHEVALGGVYGSNDRNAQLELITMGTEMAKLAADRKISSLLSKVISPEEIPVYLKKLEGRHVRGKIVAKFI